MYQNIWLVGGAGGIGQVVNDAMRPITERLIVFDRKPVDDMNSPFFCVDFSNVENSYNVCEEVAHKYGAPDSLIITAGEVVSKPFEDTNERDVMSLFNNNFLVVYNAIKLFLKHCDKSKSVHKSIVILSSNAGQVARTNQPIYAAIKAAINSLIRSLAKDFGSKYSIRINGIAPGTVIVDRNIEGLKKKFDSFPYDYNRPIPELMTPRQLVETFLWLQSKETPITGQIITIDGGSSL